jgi:excisionase family DNA binding protein
MKAQTIPSTVDDRLAYGIEEFARVAGIGRTTIFEQIRMGKLHAIKRGRRTLITADAARAWLSDTPAEQGAGP